MSRKLPHLAILFAVTMIGFALLPWRWTAPEPVVERPQVRSPEVVRSRPSPPAIERSGEPAPRTAIAGRVVDSGAPVAGATVALSDGRVDGLVLATTDADGRFELSDIDPGDYQLWAWSGARASAVARLTTAADRPPTGVDIELGPATVVDGRVAHGGDGVAARIALVPEAGQGPIRTAMTDAGGRFSIEGVARGRWRVEIDAPGHLATAPYSVEARADRAFVDVEVAPAGVASGRVIDPDGAPVADAVVIVRGADESSRRALERARASSSASSALAPGAVDGGARWVHPLAGARLLPSHDGRRFGAFREGDRPEECGMGHCGVDLGHDRGVVVHAAGAGVIRAVVRKSRGRAGRFVSIDHDGGARTYYMHLDRIRDDLAPGSRVRAGDPLGTVGTTGVLRSGPHLHFALAQRLGSRMWFVDPEPVLRSALVREVAAPLVAADTMVVADRGGADAAGFAVTGSLYRARTGADGRFTVRGLPAGEYQIAAIHDRFAPGRSAAFAAGPGVAADGVTVTLSAGVIVFGQVTDDRGRPVIGALITAEAGSDLDVRPVADAVTGFDGRYQLTALAGAVTLHVTAPGWAPEQRAVDLASGDGAADRREESFVLASADADLRGRVVDEAGFPVVGARVRIVDGPAGVGRAAVSGTGGNFLIPALPRGRYQLRLSAAGYPHGAASVSAGDAGPLALPAAGGLELEVRDAHTRAALAATVTARGPDGDERTASATGGAVVLSPLRPGSWTLVARADGYVVARQTVRVPPGSGPSPVTLRGVRLELARGAVVAGVVRDANGDRVAGARVEIGGVSAVTDRDGRFRLRDVPTGGQQLRAEQGDRAGELSLELAPGDELVTLDLSIE